MDAQRQRTRGWRGGRAGCKERTVGTMRPRRKGRTRVIGMGVLGLLLLGLLLSPSASADHGFAGGDGTADDPFRIATAEQLSSIRNYLNQPDWHFRIVSDIDLGVPPYNEGTGWDPIGSGFTHFFSGVLDGGGHTISNLTVSREQGGPAGLFGSLGGAHVFDLHLEDIAFSGSLTYVGGLSAYLLGDALLENISVTGTIEDTSTTSTNRIGGLIGTQKTGETPEIRDCWTDVSITTNLGSGVGGHTAVWHNSVGGLAGTLRAGTVSGCHATGDITAQGRDHTQGVGGLVGVNSDHGADIIGCSAHGDVTLTGYSLTGGLIGRIGGWGDTEHRVHTDVRIEDSHAYGQVTGLGDQSAAVGGLVGKMWDTVTIVGSSARGDVSANSSLGGLVGMLGNHLGSGDPCFGEIRGSFATGHVTGSTQGTSSAGRNAGGLVGAVMEGTIVIRESYALGDVLGTEGLGGLVGNTRVAAWTSQERDVEILDSYARGNVSGTRVVGGLVGYLEEEHIVDRCYAAGWVQASAASGLAGGLLGENDGVVLRSAFDLETSGQTQGIGGGSSTEGVVALTTEQMRQQASFGDWDFMDTWRITENRSYPFLQTTHLMFEDPEIPPGILGEFYERELVAVGGTGPYTFSIPDGGLPEGIGFQSEETHGLLSGVPAAMGQYGFTVQVSDSQGETLPVPFEMQVFNVPPQVVSIETDEAGSHLTIRFDKAMAPPPGGDDFAWLAFELAGAGRTELHGVSLRDGDPARADIGVQGDLLPGEELFLSYTAGGRDEDEGYSDPPDDWYSADGGILGSFTDLPVTNRVEDQSGFDLFLVYEGTKTAGTPFEIGIGDATDPLGRTIWHWNQVTVTSDRADGIVFQGSVYIHSEGPTPVPVTLETLGTHILTVQLAGIGDGGAPYDIQREIAVSVEEFGEDQKELTAFWFSAEDNPGLAEEVTGLLEDQQITVFVAAGTDVSSLVARFAYQGAGVRVGADPQESGVTPNDFAGPVVYTVEAADGSTRDYMVTVIVSPAEPFVLVDGALIRTEGIRAQVTVERTTAPDHPGTEVVVFQLMHDGTEPVSILALEKDITAPETMIAHFQVTGSGYTVRVFVLDTFSSDPSAAPVSLAVPLTLE